MHFIILVLSEFITKLLAGKQSSESDLHLTQQKSSKFQPVIMTLVSSANNTGCDAEFIVRKVIFSYRLDCLNWTLREKCLIVKTAYFTA